MSTHGPADRADAAAVPGRSRIIPAVSAVVTDAAGRYLLVRGPPIPRRAAGLSPEGASSPARRSRRRWCGRSARRPACAGACFARPASSFTARAWRRTYEIHCFVAEYLGGVVVAASDAGDSAGRRRALDAVATTGISWPRCASGAPDETAPVDPMVRPTDLHTLFRVMAEFEAPSRPTARRRSPSRPDADAGPRPMRSRRCCSPRSRAPRGPAPTSGPTTPRGHGVPAGPRIHEPEDLTSEVFLAVFDQLDRFRGGEAEFRTFVFTIAYRRLVDELRPRSNRGIHEEWDDEPRRAAQPQC